jgi:hypothetical protein
MARRAPLIAKKTKKIRVSHNESYLLNVKYMGEEPVFNKPLSNLEYANAINWYNCMSDNGDAREYIDTFLNNQGRLSEAKLFEAVPDCWVPTTCAWIARMLTKGYVLPTTAKSFFDEKLSFTLTKAKVEQKFEDNNNNRVSIQERMKEKQSDIIGQIEEILDKKYLYSEDFKEFSLYNWLKSNQIPASYCPAIVKKYSPWLSELIEAFEGKDDQLKDAYGYLKKSQIKDRILFFNKFLEDASRYCNVEKKTRAVRKPRTVSLEKKLKNLKYQKEDNNYKIASLNPEKIIGAQELWVFNTKYKVVTVFRALDRAGLQVKGTSINNYNENTSLSKGCGRKPEIVLDKLRTGTKIVLKKLLEELKTDKPLQYRINENTILMKVI